jgi:hypothetical protein
MANSANIQARIRLDNNSILEFFSSTASVLTSKGLLSSKESDNLRIVINGIQSDSSSRAEPVILQFLKQNAEFSSLLVARYGHEGLYQNILRHTLRNYFVEMRSLLAVFGSELISKSKLFLNRSVNFYHHGTVERTKLFSSVLVDLAETTHQSSMCIEDVINSLSFMMPHSMSGNQLKDSETDSEIATALGFSGVDDHSFPLQTERKIKHLTHFALENVSSCLQDFARYLEGYSHSSHRAQLAIATENLSTTAKQLTNIVTGNPEQIIQWEHRRHGLISILIQLNFELRELAVATIATVTEIGLSTQEPNQDVSEDVKRRLRFDLASKGIKISDAEAATQKLSEYLKTHKVSAENLIISELNKIHNCLSPDSLDIIQNSNRTTTIEKQNAAEKGKLLAKAESLKKVFSQHITPASKTIFALLLLLPLGCGVKTSPVSKVVELRPDVPYYGSGFELAKKQLEAERKNKIVKKKSH